MIMDATTPRALSGWTRGAMLLLAALLLPIFPTFAQEDPKRKYIRNVPKGLPGAVIEVEVVEDPYLGLPSRPQEVPDSERGERIRKQMQRARLDLERLHQRIRILQTRDALANEERAELAMLKDRLVELERMLAELTRAASRAPRARPVDPRRVDPARAPEAAKRRLHRDQDLVRRTLEEVLREDPDNEIARRALIRLEEERHAEREALQRARDTKADLLERAAMRAERAGEYENALRAYQAALEHLKAARSRGENRNPIAEIAKARSDAAAAAAREAAVKALLDAHGLHPSGLPVEEVEEVEPEEEVEAALPPQDPLRVRLRTDIEKWQAESDRRNLEMTRRAAEMEARFRDLRARNDELRAREQDLKAQLKALQAEIERLRAKKKDR